MANPDDTIHWPKHPADTSPADKPTPRALAAVAGGGTKAPPWIVLCAVLAATNAATAIFVYNFDAADEPLEAIASVVASAWDQIIRMM